MIYHLASEEDWQAALRSDVYKPESLRTEGFIHCSTGKQVADTANRFFQGRLDLVLLSVDEHRFQEHLRYENLEGGEELFPHVYAPFPLADILEATPFLPSSDGSFAFPQNNEADTP